MLYLYAITDSSRVPDGPGLRNASLRAVGEAGLFAIVSEHDELRVEATEEDLWAHEQVVEDLMDEGSLLPIRFGSALANEAAVLDLLDERRHALEQTIERVRGAVELSVRVAIVSDPDGQTSEEPGSGTAYLMDRLQRERHQTGVTGRIHEPLASLAWASTSWSTEPRRRLWKVAYLVGKERLEVFTEQVDRLDAQLSDATVLCTGPWPPYSFSSGEVTH